MKRTIILLGFILVFSSGASAQIRPFNQATDYYFPLRSFKIHQGDNPAWAQRDFDDTEWRDYTLQSNSRPVQGNYWLRARIELTSDSLKSFDFLAAQILRIPVAYELYWDGHLVLQNGTVGTDKKTEVPGIISQYAKFKPEWTNRGRHTLALRISNYHLGTQFKTTPRIRFGSNAYLQRLKASMLQIDIFDLTIFLLAVLFSFAFFLGGGPNRAYFLFMLFCLMNFIFSTSGFLSQASSISVLYSPIYTIINNYAAVIGFSFLNLFFVFNFHLPRKKLHGFLSVLLVIAVRFLLPHQYFPLAQTYSILVTAYALKQKESGSLAALIASLILMLVFFLFMFGQVYYLFFVGEMIFIFFIALSISLRFRAQNQQLEASHLRSARLETELIKKNIQPHFLMNTLFSIMSWIPVEPKKAMKLIQSLANEFRMINQISSRKVIHLTEEMKLCELHLQLMELRMDASYQFIQKIEEDDQIPPMIFHTLIENGLTHAFETGENGIFEIEQQKNGRKTVYKVRNNGSLLTQQKSNGKIKEGMGLRYIQARLEESFPGQWNLKYGLRQEYWEVKIELLRN